MGTPQGGVISPMLANIALNGLEEVIKKWIETQDVEVEGKKLYQRLNKRSSINYVRYADDFVIMHRNRSIIEKCKPIVIEFLEKRGLVLSAEKTKVQHTLINEESERNQAGFDFLGFTIKQFKTKHRSSKNTRGQPVGFRTLIYPSMESRKKHYRALRKIIKNHKKSDQKTLIKILNPVIRG